MTIYSITSNDSITAIEAASSPGTGWVSAPDLQTVIDAARSAELPLFLRAGTFLSDKIDITPSSGGGNSLYMWAVPGTVTIQLQQDDDYLLGIDSVGRVRVTGITFDGAGRNLTASTNPGLLRIEGSSAADFLIADCEVVNSSKNGISVLGVGNGTIARNRIELCDTAIVTLDSVTQIEDNTINWMNNNGIMVWTSTLTGNGTVIKNNFIQGIENDDGGTGQYGNGINIYRAGNVKILSNTIYTAKYSAIRLNAASDCYISENYCWNLRESAIFLEAPGEGENLYGGIVTGNSISTAGNGISVANSGLYGDGVARGVVVSNNRIVAITRNSINDPGYTPPVTGGFGIAVEGRCEVCGNLLDEVEGPGITLGVNDAAENLSAVGNLIYNASMSIAYSANSAAGPLLIVGNLMRGFNVATSTSDPDYPSSGAIVSATYNGTDLVRDTNGSSPNTDYGNATQTLVANLTVGNNRADA